MFTFKNSILAFALLAFLASSCGNPIKKPADTTTTGRIAISVDETFAPILDSQVSTFESLYPEAEVLANYLPEKEAFEKFEKDSMRLVVSARELTEQELAYFKSKKIFPQTTKIGYDALALIIHPENEIENIDYVDLKGVFGGGFTWDSLNKKSNLGEINAVFDNNGSSTARYIQENFLKEKAFPKNCFAVKSNKEVIEYVATHKNALGLIGVNWISDTDDPASQKFMEKIKVLNISNLDANPFKPEYFGPYQAYIATKKYPLTRSLYIISREGRTGLGTGFASFVAGDKGQRIILKSGIVPATAPVRIVGFR
jgi:phosphate transport system substrate-binding protein